MSSVSPPKTKPPQIVYLQLGASAVTRTWSSPQLKSDAVHVGALLRAELQPLTHAVAAGQYSRDDIAASSQLLADQFTASEGGAAAGDDGMEVAMGGGGAGGGDGNDGAARVLMDHLMRQPFGEVLLSFAAVTGSSWAPGETEYGR